MLALPGFRGGDICLENKWLAMASWERGHPARSLQAESSAVNPLILLQKGGQDARAPRKATRGKSSGNILININSPPPRNTGRASANLLRKPVHDTASKLDKPTHKPRSQG
jgi:hypothetical protein